MQELKLNERSQSQKDREFYYSIYLNMENNPTQGNRK